MTKKWKEALAALAALACARDAQAQMVDTACFEKLTRTSLVACATRASPAVSAERAGLRSLDGRRVAAGIWLPSNPTVSFTAGQRSSPVEGNGIDWSATLSQEVPIGGQRGKRVDLVDAEADAQRARVVAAERETGAGAMLAYFDLLAALEEKRIADRLTDLANALIAFARGRSDAGLTSTVDADVAEAAALRLAQVRFAAERRVDAASATLTVLVGGDPARMRVTVDGQLVPLMTAPADVAALVDAAVARRADVAIAAAERRTQQRRADLLRRERIPNVTLSIFAQNDRINERVLGFGVAIPIPMPAPVGQTRAGEIAEAEALADRAAADIERVRRQIRLEVTAAASALASRQREVAAYDPARLKRAEESLAAIAREVEARRLPLRDALLAQQALVELLQTAIEARRQLCFASVDLARAAALPMVGAP